MVELNTTSQGGVRLVDLPSAVEELGFAPAGVRTLSVYLDTSPPRVRGQAYLLSFRDQCRDLRATVAAEDEQAFEAARAHAERYLVGQFVPQTHGLALFAAGGSEDIVVVPLPAAPSQHIVWSERPSIASLKEMLDGHERLAVALFDAPNRVPRRPVPARSAPVRPASGGCTAWRPGRAGATRPDRRAGAPRRRSAA